MTNSDFAAGKHRLPLALISLCAGGFILLFCARYGLGLSADSAGYIAVARSLAQGKGFLSYDGTPLIAQPPLYPLLLAAAGRLGLDPIAVAPMLHAGLFALMVYLSGLLFAAHIAPLSRPLAYLGTVLIAVSPPLLYVSVWAWAEPLFICWLLLALLLSESYRRGGGAMHALLMGLCVAAAGVTRYAGIVLVPWGLAVLAAAGPASRRRRALVAPAFLAVSLLPLCLWCLRNYLLEGTPLGGRTPSQYSLLDNAGFAAQTILSWYATPMAARHPAAAPVALALAAVAAALAVRLGGPALRGKIRILWPVLLLIAGYAAFLIITSSRVAYDRIGTRLLSPIHVPLTLTLFALGAVLWERARRRFSPAARRLFFAAATAFLAAVAGAAGWTQLERVEAGAGGYNAKRWKAHPLVRFAAQDLPRSGLPVYSNAPDALYLLAEFPARLSPIKKGRHSGPPLRRPEHLEGTWPREEAYLVWFEDVERPHLFREEELLRAVAARVILSLPEGRIYRISRLPHPWHP